MMYAQHPLCALVSRSTTLWAVSLVIVSISSAHCLAETAGQLLTRNLSVGEVTRLLVPHQEWNPFPRAWERAAWEHLPAQVREAHIREGERFLQSDWITPKATDFLEFVRSGDRSGFQKVSFDRRGQLATLVLAECMEGKGRFLDDIINGIWTICEESFWGVPAHLSMQKAGFGLPDVKEPTVDLFAAETASLLSWTSYLLKDSLDRISPLVCDRIRYEVDRRILAVNRARNDFWWMGNGHRVNNWTPWICSNWLAAELLLEPDPDLRGRDVYKILECLDRFLAEYTDDGGCDEGPTYWTRAAGSLFDCLELLHAATRGGIDGFIHPRIQEMGRYITRAHINGPYFINFADASAKASPDAGTVFRYGRAIDDSIMMRFGAALARDQGLGGGVVRGQFGVLGRVLPSLFGMESLLRVRPAEPHVRDFWLPGVQVMGARSEAGSSRGLYLAAQGGHNAESHNHNDVGNCIVYADGEPVLIDVGVETYTARTFSKDRYSIWTMQSAYHNVPTINGVMQQEGREFQAARVRYAANDTSVTFALDLAQAYPPSAGVRSWLRTLTLNRGSAVTLRDAYSLSRAPGPTSLTFMTSREVDLSMPGTIRLVQENGAARPVLLSYDPAELTADVQTIQIRDPQLQASWGSTLQRMILTLRRPRLSGEITVRISQE